MEKTLEAMVNLEPKYLTTNHKTRILEKLKEAKEGSCSKNDGYVIEVLDLVKIVNQGINMSNSVSIFKVKYRAEVIKPEPDCVMTGNVCLASDQGLLVLVSDCFKVFIPEEGVENYTYDDTRSLYEKKKCDGPEFIEFDTEVEVRITSIRFMCDKRQFSCIGAIEV